MRRALPAIPGSSTLLTYMAFKSRLQGFVLKLVGPTLLKDKATKASDSLGTLHVSHFVPFENNHVGFFTVYDGDFEKYIQDFAEKTSFTFNTLFPNIVGAHQPQSKRTPRRSFSGRGKTTIRLSGFTAPIQASRF